jgi:hypothetical protein
VNDQDKADLKKFGTVMVIVGTVIKGIVDIAKKA